MATDAQLRDRLRRDLSLSSATLSDDEADALFAEAGELYTDTTTAHTYARVLALNGLLTSSAKLTSYRQNQSSESLSDIFNHLLALLKHWQGETTIAIGGNAGAARFGGVRRVPARVREYPG